MAYSLTQSTITIYSPLFNSQNLTLKENIMTKTILNIQSSALDNGSVTRGISAAVLAHLDVDKVIDRDVSGGISLVNEAWVAANFTPDADRSEEQRKLLEESNSLIEEIMAADTLVIGAPIYNFSIPAALKTWVDQICRVGATFNYGEAGPEGLVKGKRAIIVHSSAGTPIGSEIEFASGYMRHILGFIGITDITMIASDQYGLSKEQRLAAAEPAIAAISK